LADTFTLYVKTKHFHWRVTGPHFRDYHLLLDEQAEQLEKSIDILAERVRKVGGKLSAPSATSRAFNASRITMRISSLRETCCWI